MRKKKGVILFCFFVILLNSFAQEQESTKQLKSGYEKIEEKLLNKYKSGFLDEFNKNNLKIKEAAILKFDGDNKYELELIVENELKNIGKFNVIERRELSKILDEQKLALAGITDENKSVKIGKLSGADTLVMGNIYLNEMKIIKDRGFFKEEDTRQFRLGINTKVVNSETGKIEMSYDFKDEINELIYKKNYTRGNTYVPGILAGAGAYALYYFLQYPYEDKYRDSNGNIFSDGAAYMKKEEYQNAKNDFTTQSIIVGVIDVIISIGLSELTYNVLP